MFATWILCLFLLMIAPYLTLEAGVLRKKKCAALGAGRGYRTELSMASQEAWDYAQQICSKRYMIAGILMAVAALLFIRVAPTDTPCKPVCVHRRHRVVRGGHGHSADRIGGNQPSQAFCAQNGRLICPFLHSFLHRQSPNDFKTVRALLYAFGEIPFSPSAEGKRGFHYAFPSSINAVSAASISSISVIAFTLTRSLAASRMPRT